MSEQQSRAMRGHFILSAVLSGILLFFSPVDVLSAVHKVAKGDNAGKIAGRYGISLKELRAANPRVNLNKLRQGQNLNIPGSAKSKKDAKKAQAAKKPEAKKPGTKKIEAKKPETQKRAERVDKRPATPGRHTVSRGENVASIARKYGLNQNALRKANPRVNMAKLKIGQVLNLPGSGSGAVKAEVKPQTTPRIHVVGKNETGGNIAAKYGLSLKQLAAMNKGKNLNKLRRGEKLTVSVKAPAASQQEVAKTQETNKREAATLKQPEPTPAPEEPIIPEDNEDVSTVSQESETVAKEVTPQPREESAGTAVETAPAAKSKSYTVDKGESWTSIARKTGLPVEDLKAANQGLGSELSAGQMLTLPSDGNAAEAKVPDESTNKVKILPLEPSGPANTVAEKQPGTTRSAILEGQEVANLPSGRSILDMPAVKVSPADQKRADEIYEKGNALGKKNLYTQALEHFNQAIKIDPTKPEYYASRGHAFYYLKSYAKAIDDYSRTLSLDTQSSIAFCMRGLSYTRMGEPQKALKDFDKAIKIAPQEADYYKGRGYCYYQMKQYDSMCKDYAKACTLGDCEFKENSDRAGLCNK